MTRFTAALVLVLFMTPAVWAATPTDALRQVFRQADRILTEPQTEERPLERLLAVRKLVNEAFDFRRAAELASGDRWWPRTLAEQEEFTWLFGDLLERSFIAIMASTASLKRGTRIRYLGESVMGGTALVRTVMGRRDGGEMLLDYRLIERDGSWKVRDVTIDGVSMMANYRAQLDRVLGNASFPELLTQMRAKVGAVDPPARPVSFSPVETATLDVSLPPKPQPVAKATTPAEVISGPDVSSRPETAATATPPAGVRTASTPPEAPTPPPAVTLQPRARTTKAYWLRVSTVESADQASRLVSRLRDGKLSVVLERSSVGGTSRIQISVGPFRDATEAVLTLLDLQLKGHDPFLVAERE